MERMTSRAALLVLVPAICFSTFTLTAYAFAVANPLPWNGYGHDAFRLNSTVMVPAGTEMTVRILGDMRIPAKSFVWTQLYVLTRGSDGNPAMADFQFFYNEENTSVVPGWGMVQSFETAVETQRSLNPEYVVGNPQPFDLQVLEYASVTVPPTTVEHVGLLLPWVAAVGSIVSLGVDLLVLTANRFRSRTPRG